MVPRAIPFATDLRLERRRIGCSQSETPFETESGGSSVRQWKPGVVLRSASVGREYPLLHYGERSGKQWSRCS